HRCRMEHDSLRGTPYGLHCVELGQESADRNAIDALDLPCHDRIVADPFAFDLLLFKEPAGSGEALDLEADDDLAPDDLDRRTLAVVVRGLRRGQNLPHVMLDGHPAVSSVGYLY